MRTAKKIALFDDAGASFELPLTSQGISDEFTFTRASSATYVDVNGTIQTATTLGSELVTNGGFDTDTDWTKVGTTISGGVASFNDTDGTAYIYQPEPTTVNKDVVLTFTIKNYVKGGVSWNTGVPAGTVRSANGTYTEIIERGSNGNILFADNGSTTLDIDNVSVKEVIYDDVPRIDYSDGEPAFLLEPASTNLITYSEGFSDASWLLYNGTTKTGVSGVTAPDGTTNAYGIALGAVGGNFDSSAALYRQVNHTDTVDYTFSCYIRSLSGSETVRIGMSLGTSYDTGDTSINETWQRLEVTGVATSTAVGNVSIREKSAGGGTNIIIWGAQLEALSYPTSYIATAGATATRSAELCVNGGSASVINSVEGTMVVEMGRLINTGTRIISLSDGTINNRIQVTLYNSDLIFYIMVGGVEQVYITEAISGGFNKIAVKWKEDDFALWVNGVEKATDISGSVVGAGILDRIRFCLGSADNNVFYGKVKSLQIYKEALSDSDLESKTT